MTTPVLLLIFSRLDTTTEVFSATREARPERLCVAADGPRADREAEAERCEETQRIATEVDWHCKVRTMFREKNLGCRCALSGAIIWLFEHEEEGIIFEDDRVLHPSFFPYCAALPQPKVPPRAKTLDLVASSGDLAAKRQATWRMSVMQPRLGKIG